MWRCAARIVLLAGVVTLVGSATVSAATPKAWNWSETYAEKTLTAKLLMPCANIRAASDCSSAGAASQLASYNAMLARCKTMACIGSLAHVRSPISNLSHVQSGFPLSSVYCIGSGSPDKSGFRFTQFRCEIAVADQEANGVRVNVTGRMLVYVSGETTFRWKLIG